MGSARPQVLRQGCRSRQQQVRHVPGERRRQTHTSTPKQLRCVFLACFLHSKTDLGVIPSCPHPPSVSPSRRAWEAHREADALWKTRETLLFLFPHRRRTFTRRRSAACSLSSSSSSSLRAPPSCRPAATWPTTVSLWGEAKQHHRCDGWTVTRGRRLILLTGLSSLRAPPPTAPPPPHRNWPAAACCSPHGEQHRRPCCHPVVHLLVLFRLFSSLMHDTLGANKLRVKPPSTAIWLPTAAKEWRWLGRWSCQCLESSNETDTPATLQYNLKHLVGQCPGAALRAAQAP